MTKAAKFPVILVILLVIAALGAELAVGWICYHKLTASVGMIDGIRTDNNSLRGELVSLREETASLREEAVSLRGELEDYLEQAAGQGHDPAQEDDVVIANEYVIRSTLPISNAYRSGDRSALTDKEKETLDMASEILSQIITDGMSPYEKEQAVYVWMTENLEHDQGLLPVIPRTQADCDNPYGVLKFHNAVCVGYATTFRLFMQMLEIPCMVVHNSECYHSWDLVQLDGSWYHTDIYSDVGSASFNHFNMTDSMQSMNQSWNTGFFPAAADYTYCYAARDAVDMDDIYSIPAALRQALDDRKSHLALRFAEMDETNAAIVEMMLNNISSRIDNSSYCSELSIYWSWLPAEQNWLLAVTLNWYSSEEPEPEIPDEAYEKTAEAVDEAFGDLDTDGWWNNAVG